jgi:hypothetical protein
MNTILQIPMKKELRDKAAIKAGELGFSSLQEPVRIFLKQLALGEVSMKLQTTVDVAQAVLNSREEAKNGKARKLKGSLVDLWHEAQIHTDN